MTGRSAARRYTLVTFLTWLPIGLYLATAVLLTLHRGLDVAEVAAVGAIMSVTCSVLELPTGGLADVLGRRTILLASTLANLLALALTGVATTFWMFAAAAVLRGTARALGSGPAEAWFVDTVHAADGPGADLGPGLARGGAACSAGLAVGTLIGGMIPFAFAVPLAVPVLLAAAVEGVRLVVVAVALPEPRHARPGLAEVLRGVPATVLAGLRLGTRDSVIARLLLTAAAAGIALTTIELLTPAWLATVTGRAETAGLAYAVVAFVGFVASGAGSALSVRAVRLLGSPARAGAAGGAVSASALVLLAGSTALSGLAGVGAAAVAYCLMFVGIGISAPALAELLHGRVGSAERATVVSVQSLALQLAGAVGAVALGTLATWRGPAAAYAVAAVVLIGPAAVLLRMRVGVERKLAHSAR